MPQRTLRSILPPVLLLLLGLGVYVTSLGVPLIFDDIPALRENPHLRRLWPLSVPLTAPPESPLGARPVSSFTFAANYALHGLNVSGYHIFNLALHLLSALLLWSLLRRVLSLPALRARLGNAGPWLATCIAAVWVVHPLLSEAVVYALQRTELLVSFFCLLTLFCALRLFEGGKAWLWTLLAVLACALGMGSKEVMVGVPLLVLVLDRTFFTPGWGEALRRRRGLYAGLASTWLLLALLVWSEPRRDSAGFHHTIGALDYLRAQAGVILLYLKLIAWPVNLSIIHPREAVTTWGPALLPGAIILALLGLTGYAVARRRAMGVSGAAFFLLLAPTSSVIPIVTEVAAERRMYLPTATVLCVVIPAIYLLLLRIFPRESAPPAAPAPMPAAEQTPDAAPATAPAPAPLTAPHEPALARQAMIALTVIAVGLLGFQTLRRVGEYRTAVSIWESAVAVYPQSPDAWNNLGVALGEAGRDEEAIRVYERVLSLDPHYLMAQVNLGNCHFRLHRYEEARASHEKALAMQPKSIAARTRLAQDLIELNRKPEAAAQFRTLVEQEPENYEARYNLGLLLTEMGRAGEALPHLEKAASLRPGEPDAQASYAAALVAVGRSIDAVPIFENALRIQPNHLGARLGVGKAMLDQNRLDDADAHLRKAIEINPTESAAYEYLGAALANRGRAVEAAAQFARVVELRPGDAAAHHNFAAALTRINKLRDAADQFALAAQLDPQNAARQVALGQALARAGRADDSLARLRKAVEIAPGSPEARVALADSLAEQRRAAEAIPHYREALKARPRWAPAMTGLAWCLATRANCTHAEALEAVALAQGAVELTGGRIAHVLDALGVALAQAGQFDKAVAAGQRALERSVADGEGVVAQEIQGRIGLYLAKKPYVEAKPQP